MAPVYGLLLLALLVLVLYATWRPSSGEKLRRVQKTRTTMKSAQRVTQMTTRTEMHPLDYPTTDVAASTGTALRRPGAKHNRELKYGR
jgi:hypothetical protein